MDQQERPSPTKRPRVPPDVDDNDFLARRAIEVYNGAQRSGSYRMIALSTRPENELGTLEFDDVDEHFGPGSSYVLDCDNHDHLNGSIRCTYKCRNMVNTCFLAFQSCVVCELLCMLFGETFTLQAFLTAAVGTSTGHDDVWLLHSRSGLQ